LNRRPTVEVQTRSVDAVGVEVVGIALVGFLDVLDEPFAEKIEDGNGVGFAAFVEVGFVFLDIGHEPGVLIVMSGEIRIAGLAHEDFFLEEMGASVDGELGDHVADDVFALANAHGIGERIDDLKELLVLSVELLDVNAVGFVPRKCRHG